MYSVLIVEDEDIIRKGLSYKVDWSSYDCVVVDTAEDGIEGLKKIKEYSPEIVITDIRMPFKDGLEMLREAMKTSTFEAIILSGFSEFGYAQQAISLGVSEYLLKPVSFSLLEEAIVKLIKKIQLRQGIDVQQKSLQTYQELLDINVIGHQSAQVSRVINYIKGNYAKKITLADLSKELMASSVSLNSKFKEETSYTFTDFLNRFRILKAIEIISKEEKLIYEVAELVGFKDYKYFSSVFKKYVGYSPSQFLNRF